MGLGLQLAALVTCACAVSSEDLPNLEDSISRSEQICDMFAKNSNFIPDDIIRIKRWRIYFSWNIDMADRCLEMTFDSATAASTRRFWSDMNEYLESEPPWEAATFLVTMGNSNHEMMLFADQGPAGRMLGVPNIRRDSNVLIPKKSVPLLKFQLKLMSINLQTFLVMMDCNTQVTTLSFPTEVIAPYKTFYYAASLLVPIRFGRPACMKKHEEFFQHHKNDYELL